MILSSMMYFDILLRGRSGIQLAEDLTASNPQIKIIPPSGKTDLNTNLRESTEGRYKFIEKPYTLDILLHAMNEVVENRKNISS